MISYEYFNNVIKELQMADDLINSANDIVQIEFMCNISMQDTVIDLLSRMMNDVEDFISYWVYEMDFGRKWTDDTCTEKDDTPIILKTTRQLYDYLVKNYGGNTNE